MDAHNLLLNSGDEISVITSMGGNACTEIKTLDSIPAQEVEELLRTTS